MDKALDDKLVADFPKIFRDRYGDKSLTAMNWGFNCGNGWYNIIHDLCECIQDRINNSPINFYQVFALQVKEKFGALRFYYTFDYEVEREYIDGEDSYHEDEIEGMVEFAEMLSTHICEQCGARGELKKIRGWMYTLCDTCRKKSKGEKK